MRVLNGHTSVESAFVIADYPFGFTKRCQKRVWIETNKRGQRLVEQTSNPDVEGAWNKPKKSNYFPILVMHTVGGEGKDADYVTHSSLGMYATATEEQAFRDKFGAEAFADDYRTKTLELLARLRAAMEARYARRQAAEVPAEIQAEEQTA